MLCKHCDGVRLPGCPPTATDQAYDKETTPKPMKYLDFVDDRHHYLRAVFTRQITGDQFRHYIFNHVYLLMSYNAKIWEQPRPMDVVGFSHDKYDDRGGVEIVLPVDLRAVDAVKVLEAAPGQFKNCTAAACWALGEFGLWGSHGVDEVLGLGPCAASVDDLYFALRQAFGNSGLELARHVQCAKH